jgi:hypothetical protein
LKRINILHIIDNGFDLNLDLKTNYKDFYQYYNSIDNETESIKLLMNKISKDYLNWSDLELGLGRAELKTSKPKTLAHS